MVEKIRRVLFRGGCGAIQVIVQHIGIGQNIFFLRFLCGCVCGQGVDVGLVVGAEDLGGVVVLPDGFSLLCVYIYVCVCVYGNRSEKKKSWSDDTYIFEYYMLMCVQTPIFTHINTHTRTLMGALAKSPRHLKP
jgi:hypothetical protein